MFCFQWQENGSLTTAVLISKFELFSSYCGPFVGKHHGGDLDEFPDSYSLVRDDVGCNCNSTVYKGLFFKGSVTIVSLVLVLWLKCSVFLYFNQVSSTN